MHGKDKPIASLPDLITKDEVAACLRVSRRTINRWMASGHLPYVQITPTVVRFDVEAVAKAMGLNAD